jgi:hypothetical protein
MRRDRGKKEEWSSTCSFVKFLKKKISIRLGHDNFCIKTKET